MKKTNILIAVFAVLTTVSMARAEVRVDFDGSASGSESFTEALKTNAALNSDGLVPLPVPITEPYPCTESAIQSGPCDNFFHGGSITSTWPGWLPPGSCWGISSGPGWIGCSVNPGAFSDHVYDNKAAGIDGLKKRTTIPSRSEVAALAGFYSRQEVLKGILARYFNAHPEFPSDIAALIKNDKTKILYDDTGVYIINGRRLFILGDKNLITSAKETGLSQNKVTVVEVGIGVAIGCVFSSDCWEVIGDAVSDVVEGATSNDYNDPNETGNCASESTC